MTRRYACDPDALVAKAQGRFLSGQFDARQLEYAVERALTDGAEVYDVEFNADGSLRFCGYLSGPMLRDPVGAILRDTWSR